MKYFKTILMVIAMFLSFTLFGQKKELSKAIEKGENSHGYIFIMFKYPQTPEDVKKLSAERGYDLLGWTNDQTIKYGDHVEGPMNFFIMKKDSFRQLMDDCRNFDIKYELKDLESCIDRVKQMKLEQKRQKERELAEQKRVDAIAAHHVPNFNIDPNWNSFTVSQSQKDIQTVSYNGNTGVVFKGTKTWIIPPLYRYVYNYKEKYYLVAKSFKDGNPQVFDLNYHEIKWKVIKQHSSQPNGTLLQVIQGDNGLYGLLRKEKDGTTLIAFPPIAKEISSLINFRKENLVFSGYEENDIIAFTANTGLGFLNKSGRLLLDSIDVIEEGMYKLPVLPFTEFLVLKRKGERCYFDPIKLELYREQAIRVASNDQNERQIAEHFQLFKAVGQGMKAGLKLLLQYSNQYSSGYAVTSNEKTKSAQIIYKSPYTKVEIEKFEPHNQSTTYVEIISTYTSSDKYYFSQLKVLDKDKEGVRKAEYNDPVKDNHAEIFFDNKYGDYLEVTVKYGITDYPFFGEPKYKGVGAIINLFEKGTYRIKVTKIN